jgi:enediyne biosynthesis protein E4
MGLYNHFNRCNGPGRAGILSGHANFVRSNGLPAETLAGSCVVPFDLDNDNDLDLFVGTRLTPGRYPISSPSMLLINDGKGHFADAISQYAPSLQSLGMICDAIAQDINKDGLQDLVVVGEWMPIKVFINQKNGLVDASDQWVSGSTRGWWNRIIGEDFDNDGDVDFIVGNYGLNNQFAVSSSHPATLIYKDFNHDGQVDPFFCYYIGQQSYPYASRDEALGQVDILRPRFPDYNSYSKATMETIFTKEELETADELVADNLKTVMLENVGDHFELRDLPIQAQYAPVYAIAAYDIDQDGDKDLVMGGNETKVRVRIGRADANEGMLLLNDGKGNFSYVPQNKCGLELKGDARQLLFLSNKKKTSLIVGQTGQTVKSYALNSK